MSDSYNSIFPDELRRLIGRPDCPPVIDVRRRAVFDAADSLIPGARWCDYAEAGRWAQHLPPGADIIVYCVHGHNVSQAAIADLRRLGFRARALAGGIEAYAEDGGLLLRKSGMPLGGMGNAAAAGSRGSGRRSTASPAPGWCGDSSIPRRSSTTLPRIKWRRPGKTSTQRPTTFPARRSPMTANSAASMRSSRGSASKIRRSTGLRSSCAARIPAIRNWRRNAPGSWRPRSDCRRSTPTITKCCNTV